MQPLNTTEIDVAIAAPATPQPKPGSVNERPSSATRRVGKIRNRFRPMLIRFMPRLTSIGVRASPEARSALPRITESDRNSIGAHTIA